MTADVDVEVERSRWFDEFERTRSEKSRAWLLESYLPLADYFARRYVDRSVELDDLRQVARLGLVNAIDRFDPGQDVKFSTYAGRTIDGELKRWFRDKTWAVRVPRSIQENALAVGRAQTDFEKENNRPPTPAELATATGLALDEIIEALDARANYRAVQIDRPTREDAGQTLADTLTSSDSPYEESDMQMLLATLLDSLPERERGIIRMHFFDEMSQQEIADQIGMSQMHVSRLLRRALESLQGRFSTDSDA